MRYYFDNRNFTNVYAIIYIDADEIGYLHLRKNKITAFDLPLAQQEVRISFQKKKPLSPKLNKTVIEESVISIKKEKLNQNFRKIDDRWQFPYDCIITDNQEDILFYPSNFNKKNLKGGLYYKAVYLSDSTFVNLKLTKKIEMLKIEKYRKKNLLLYSLLAVMLLIVLVYAISRVFETNISGYDRRGMSWTAIGALLGLLYSSNNIGLYMKYDGMFNEKALKNTYYISKDGKLLDGD